MHLLRTIFADEIIAEFLPPVRKDRRQVIILCDGLPAVPQRVRLIEYFSSKGYWVFHPRYRGTWESSGVFLKNSPNQDIVDVIAELPTGFISLYDQVKYRFEPDNIFVLGASFGGAAALLASLDDRVKKVVAVAPVVDWTKIAPEDFMKEQAFIKTAFNQAYRYDKDGDEKLKRGEIYNPVSSQNKFDGKKILIVHAKDDDLVPYEPVKNLADRCKAQLVSYGKGGHFGLSVLLRWQLRRRVLNFLKS